MGFPESVDAIYSWIKLIENNIWTELTDTNINTNKENLNYLLTANGHGSPQCVGCTMNGDIWSWSAQCTLDRLSLYLGPVIHMRIRELDSRTKRSRINVWVRASVRAYMCVCVFDSDWYVSGIYIPWLQMPCPQFLGDRKGTSVSVLFRSCIMWSMTRRWSTHLWIS